MGWLNIYAAVYDDSHSSIFDITQRYGKQLMWIGAASILAFFIMLTDSKVFTAFSLLIYIGYWLSDCCAVVWSRVKRSPFMV